MTFEVDMWIMTRSPLQPDPTLIFLHKPSHSQPLNSNAKKSNASKLRCNYKATHRVASLHLALLNLSKNLVKAKKAHHHHMCVFTTLNTDANSHRRD